MTAHWHKTVETQGLHLLVGTRHLASVFPVVPGGGFVLWYDSIPDKIRTYHPTLANAQAAAVTAVLAYLEAEAAGIRTLQHKEDSA